MLAALGVQLLATSVDGGQAAVELDKLFGGLSGLQQAAGSFAQNFFSEEERKAQVRTQLQGRFAEFGAPLPADRAAFRDLVAAQRRALGL